MITSQNLNDIQDAVIDLEQNAADKTSGNATLNTTYIDGSGAVIHWEKTGRIVTLYGWIPTSQTVSNATIIATDLPVPYLGTNLYFMVWDAAYAITNPLYFLVTSDGKIKLANSMSVANSSIRFSYTYIANS